MTLKILLLFLVFTILFSFPLNNTFASSVEPLLITSSTTMEKVIFDGKWTFLEEWKSSSLNQLIYDDGTKIILRYAHQDNFIYFFIDAVNDSNLNKGMDKATICIDGKNNKSYISDENDFCFSSTLGNKQGGIVFQGGSINGITGNFEKIPNPKNFIGLSNISNESNPYNKFPHPNYEFKIPIDLIERSDNYGFYLSVYDAHSKSFYTWPQESIRETYFKIPSPEKWGDIISPDKSIPELNFPFLVLMISIFSIILFQSKVRSINQRF